MLDVNYLEGVLERYLNPYTYNICLSIMNILDEIEEYDYETDLDPIIYRDLNDIDPSEMTELLINTFKKNVVKYIKSKGVIVDNDEVKEQTLSGLYNIMFGLYNLKNIDASIAITIVGLNNDNVNPINMLDIILNMLNPEYDTNIYNYIVKDVSNTLIDLIIKKANDIVSDSEITTEIDEDKSIGEVAVKLIDKIHELGFNNIPDNILNLLINPSYYVVIDKQEDILYNNIIKRIAFIGKDILKDSVIDTDEVEYLKNEIRLDIIELITYKLIHDIDIIEVLNTIILDIHNVIDEKIMTIHDIQPVVKEVYDNLENIGYITYINKIGEKYGEKEETESI